MGFEFSSKACVDVDRTVPGEFDAQQIAAWIQCPADRMPAARAGDQFRVASALQATEAWESPTEFFRI